MPARRTNTRGGQRQRKKQKQTTAAREAATMTAIATTTTTTVAAAAAAHPAAAQTAAPAVTTVETVETVAMTVAEGQKEAIPAPAEEVPAAAPAVCAAPAAEAQAQPQPRHPLSWAQRLAASVGAPRAGATAVEGFEGKGKGKGKGGTKGQGKGKDKGKDCLATASSAVKETTNSLVELGDEESGEVASNASRSDEKTASAAAANAAMTATIWEALRPRTSTSSTTATDLQDDSAVKVLHVTPSKGNESGRRVVEETGSTAASAAADAAAATAAIWEALRGRSSTSTTASDLPDESVVKVEDVSGCGCDCNIEAANEASEAEAPETITATISKAAALPDWPAPDRVGVPRPAARREVGGKAAGKGKDKGQVLGAVEAARVKAKEHVAAILAMTSVEPRCNDGATTTVHVRPCMARLCVGRGGSNIKLLEKKSGTSIWSVANGTFEIRGPPAGRRVAAEALQAISRRGWCSLQFDDYKESNIEAMSSKMTPSILQEVQKRFHIRMDVVWKGALSKALVGGERANVEKALEHLTKHVGSNQKSSLQAVAMAASTAGA